MLLVELGAEEFLRQIQFQCLRNSKNLGDILKDWALDKFWNRLN